MIGERAWVTGLPATSENLLLVRDIRSARDRGLKADPGDRLDIGRFEALATRLEQAGRNQRESPMIPVSIPAPGLESLLLGQDASAWPNALPIDVRSAAQQVVARGEIPILLVDPFRAGGGGPSETVARASGPAPRWDSDGAHGRFAVEARFRAQIEEAIAADGTHRTVISPSGIQNSVVTEILHEFVATTPGSTRVDAPVEYRDGSRSAHPFPLRALPLGDQVAPASLELKFVLLSVRHAEMDMIVDGAWLRNAEVSRPRPAAETDDFVYELSLRQLEELCRNERHVHIHMFQTGLETAVMGFYRAVTTYLLTRPGSLSVQPMYFEKRHPSDDKELNPAGPSPRVITESSQFRKGKAWTT